MRYAVSTRESEGNKEIIWGLSNQFDFIPVIRFVF